MALFDAHCHLDQLADPDQALKDFYTATLNEAAEKAGVSQRLVRDWFEDELITPARTRGQVYRDVEYSEGLPNTAAEILNEAYIIRTSVRGKDVWYQLAHDRLVEPVLESNKEWQLPGHW